MAAASLDDVDGEQFKHVWHGEVDPYLAHVRAIISNLYMLIVQAHDYQGPSTQQAMAAEMYAVYQYILVTLSDMILGN